VHRPERDLAEADPEGVAHRAVEVDDGVEGALDQHALVRHVLVDLALQQLPQRRHPDHAGDAAVLEGVAERVGVDPRGRTRRGTAA
jgi:hypothetical protein